MATIFISYSHLDETWKDRVQRQLTVLQTAGIGVVTWEDRQIAAGEDWYAKIEHAIQGCDVAVLLISPNFLTSRFILQDEVPKLLKLRVDAQAIAVPVILAPCQWQLIPWLKGLQARPKDGVALSGMSNHEAETALSDLAGEIARLIEQKPALPSPKASVQASAQKMPVVRQAKLYGREDLLKQMEAALKRDDVLALYGFRGNGKSALIRELQKTSTELPPHWAHLDAGIESSARALYRRLADRLGDHAERPEPPSGSVDEMVTSLRARFPTVAPAVIWIDRAHLWFHGEGWEDEGVSALFRAMRQAFSGCWRWVFELRERPAGALKGPGITQFEVQGLDRNSLGQWLQSEAPQGREAEWRYTGDQLKRIYQWLGGGQGAHAHPQATHILIEVARGKQITPLEALRGVLDSIEDRIEEKLLADLFDTVLSPEERTLLQALALYRNVIPHDHLDRLEQRLPAPNAGAGLDRRLLLASESDQERYYLHGFVAGWVRHRLGYPDASEEAGAGDLPPGIASNDRRTLERLHALVADCWLQSLGGAKRISSPNVTKALEAFHHALAAGQSDRLEGIAVELFGGNADRVVERLWTHDEDLRTKRAPLHQQIAVLKLITALDPYAYKAWRFLGESLDKNKAPWDEVLRCHERALLGIPDYPQYLANVGNLLLRKGKDGAATFLTRLDTHRVTYPQSVNDYVHAIEAECLVAVGRGADASRLRWERIAARSNNAVFYTAEANYQLSLSPPDPDEALRVLDLAVEHRAANAYTDSIRATALEQLGRGPEATALRQERIAAGSDNPVLYTAEAEYQLAKGDPAEALRVLDLAVENRATDHITNTVRAKALEAQKRSAKSSRKR